MCWSLQALLLPYLTKMLGERHLLVFGLLFSITEQALLALSVAKWQAIAAVSLSAFAGVSFPAISSLKSTHASAEQQGLVQGALAGIRAVAAGIGPLGLAQLFAMSTTSEAALGYKPSVVFW
jgi:DHA1 family tetracycline resistance protein-like MFS transporter